MAKRINRAYFSVGTPGTGNFTVGAAETGYRTLGAAHDGMTFDGVLAANAAGDWEMCNSCTYTHSTTTLTRGTREDSSSGGAAVNFSTATKVFIDLSAASQAQLLSRVLDTATSGAITGLVGVDHVVVMSSMTANRDYTLPVLAVGERCRVSCPVGSATYALIVKTNSTQTCVLSDSATAVSTEITRLFIGGESLEFECYDTNKVRVAPGGDGRIPCKMVLRLTTSTSGSETASTFYAPTALSGVWTLDTNVGGCGATSNGRFTGRRAMPMLNVSGRAFPVNSITDGGFFTVRIHDGTTTFCIQQIPQGAAAQPQYSYAGQCALAQGAYLEFQTRNSDGNKYCNLGSTFCITEVL